MKLHRIVDFCDFFFDQIFETLLSKTKKICLFWAEIPPLHPISFAEICGKEDYNKREHYPTD